MKHQLLSAAATELAAAIRERRLASLEVVEAYLERIATLNPTLNALVTLEADAALAAARQADAALARGECRGPLHGVPITVKDALETAGVRTTCGFPPLRDYYPHRDATAVARLRAAGAILLGKTNLPTLTSDYQTANSLFGRSNNPWNSDCTPGGSSGGGAAAVAAGLSPLDLGSDVGGSLRLPAHYCGIFALKPTARRIPLTGHIPPLPGKARSLRHLSTIGFQARSLEDLWLALQLCAGPDGQEWFVPPVPLQPRPQVELRHLRVAWETQLPGLPLSGEISRALELLATDLQRAGCQVERGAPQEVDLLEACALHGELFAAELSAGMPLAALHKEQARMERLCAAECDEPYTRGYARGLDSSIRAYHRLMQARDAAIGGLERFLEGWDVWLCPVAPTTAPRHCRAGTPIEVEGRQWPYLAQGWYCLPFSLTHHPAVVVPLGLSASGLPFGVQIVGRLWREHELLAAAAALTAVIAPLPPPQDRSLTPTGA